MAGRDRSSTILRRVERIEQVKSIFQRFQHREIRREHQRGNRLAMLLHQPARAAAGPGGACTAARHRRNRTPWSCVYRPWRHAPPCRLPGFSARVRSVMAAAQELSPVLRMSLESRSPAPTAHGPAGVRTRVSGHSEPWLRECAQCDGGSWWCGPRSERRGCVGEQRLPHSRGEFDGPVGRMNADALKHIDQVGVDIDLVQPARHQQTPDDTDALRTDLARSEQPVSFSERNRTQRPFQVVRVDGHPRGRRGTPPTLSGAPARSATPSPAGSSVAVRGDDIACGTTARRPRRPPGYGSGGRRACPRRRARRYGFASRERTSPR